jgi:hypothetical protein
MGRSIRLRAVTSAFIAAVALVRHPLILLSVAALGVFMAEPHVISGTTPLISGLSEVNRIDLYNQVIVVTASLMGFIVAAIAILVSLDGGRKIVEELKRGASFQLLITNMLAAVFLLFTITTMGIAGSVLEGSAPTSTTFEAIYEWLLIGTSMELVLVGFFFAIVTYKVASAD